MAVTINGNGSVTGITSGAGKVLQIVQNVEQGPITFGTTLADALTASITPTSSNSKIIVQWSMHMGRGVDDYGEIRLYRGTSEISGARSTANTGSSPNATSGIWNRGSIAGDYHFIQCVAGSYLDSPATTSSTTYRMKAKCTYGSNVYMNRPEIYNNNYGYAVCAISSLTLFEVA